MTTTSAQSATTEPDLRPVLLAVGPDGDVEAALRVAAQEATTRGCPLTLLHVFHVLPTGPETALLEVTDAEAIAARRLRLVEEHASRVLAGQVELVPTLVRGPVVPSIVEASTGCRLVVLQRRDLSHLQRVVTRSTSSGVAAHAQAPVAVVPEGWTARESVRDVVVGVDVPSRSHAVLREALAQARSRRARLRVVHTWWSPGYFDDLHMDRYASRSWASDAAEEIGAVVDEVREDADEVAVEIETRHGRPAQVLVDASRSSALVVVGRHDALVPSGSHMGPVARAVLRDTSCPVLLVSPSPTGSGPRAWRHPGHRTEAVRTGAGSAR